MSPSKFNQIRFPFFALRRPPTEIIYGKDEIYIRQGRSRSFILLDTVTADTLDLPYLERVLHAPNRLEFEYTCRNLTELIMSKSKWGVDSIGRIFNLTRRQRFPARCLPVIKQKDNLIWLKHISYPFHIDKSIDLNIIDWNTIKAVVALIDEEWTLLHFDYYSPITEVIL